MPQWSAGLLPTPLNSDPGMKLLEQAVNTRPSYDPFTGEQGVTDPTYPIGNILRYGAVADSGHTDNRSAIMAAVTAVKGAGGGTVYIPAASGYYGVSAPMAFVGDAYSRITVRGDGWGSYIKHTANHDGSGANPAIFAFIQDGLSGYLQDLSFRDFRLSGNSGTLDLIQGIRLSGTQRAQILNVRLENVGYEGVYFNGPSITNDALVQGCWATNVGKAANVSAYNVNSNRARVIGNYAYDVGQFVEHTGYDITVTGNVFVKASFQGILIQSTSSTWTDTFGGTGTRYAERCTITGNTISDAPTGVYIGDATNARGKLLVADNVFHLCRRGVDAGASNDEAVVIQDNYFYDTPGATNGCVQLGAGRIVVQGNTFHKGPTASWAFLVKSSVDDYHTIRDNTIIDVPWTSAAFEIAGMKALVKDNIFQPLTTSMVGVAPLRMIGGAQQMFSGVGQDVDHTQPISFGGGVRSVVLGFRVPTAMTWKVKDLIENGSATPTHLGWLCTVAGTAGTLGAITGSITIGTAALTTSAGTGLYPGAMITIAGVTGIKTIVSGSGTAWVIDSNASATVAGAAVAYSPPTFVAFGQPQAAAVADMGALSTTQTSGATYTATEQAMLASLKTDVTTLRTLVNTLLANRRTAGEQA